MSRYLIECTIDGERLDLFAALRADHYAFLLEHREMIVVGGPARNAAGAPETMIIVVEVDTLERARAFIADEPYHRAGGFANVRIRPWSQVLPEPTPGSLRQTYQTELARRPPAG